MVDQNIASAEASGVGILSSQENEIVEKIADIYRKKMIVPCTACQYCMPCPSGVNIPQNFALLNNRSFGQDGGIANRVIQWLVTRNYKHLAINQNQLKTKENNGRASLVQIAMRV